MAFKWNQKGHKIQHAKLPVIRPNFNRAAIWGSRFLLNTLCYFLSPLGHRGNRSRCVNLTDTLTTLPVCKFLCLPTTGINRSGLWCTQHACAHTQPPDCSQTLFYPPLHKHCHHVHALAVSQNALVTQMFPTTSKISYFLGTDCKI